MHEYIKKLSVSIGLLSNNIKDTKIKSAFEDLQMSLITSAANFSLGREYVNLSKYFDIRLVLVQVVDLLDLSRIAGVISLMNADIITSATLRLIGEVDNEIANLRNFTLPRFELSEMSERLLRDRAREKNQDKHIHDQSPVNPNFKFKFTDVPDVLFSSSNDDMQLVASNSTVAPPEHSPNSVATEMASDVQNISKNIEPLVYTFFGSEDKIIKDRKAKLLEILKIGGGVAIGDIAKHFPGLNTKTLQRDLLDLMREKKVIMLGAKRWAKYYLK